MKTSICSAFASLVMIAGAASAQDDPRGIIRIIDPPEKGFFSKSLDFHGIPIKGHAVVSNEAFYACYDRLARETEHIPMVVSNLAAAGAEEHIIGRNQVTTDLPEWQHDKHVCLDEYNGLTRDQRTRGMGGLTTSCGEENVLNLPNDRYRGSDICMHEFAHNIEGSGIPRTLRARFDEQYQKSKDKGLWLGSYAGSNPSEYFAELTMWYFGSHGSLNNLQGEKPETGAEGLKKYDPEAYALLDEFYSGRIPIERLEPRPRRGGGGNGTNNVAGGGRQGGGTNTFMRRDSTQSRTMVARLSSYKVGETKVETFFADAGMSSPNDGGTNGWVVSLTNSPAADQKFIIAYRSTIPNARQGAPTNNNSTNTVSTATVSGTNAPATQGTRGGNRGGGRGGGSASRGAVAEVEFKGGVLSVFTWRN